ncbi:sigma-70 family RNA polymerase sigma factor [Brevibacillus sp. HB1.3]|uniref:RNA polymerase sigma factor n=1 Tax=Brevibacillus sp. HB1.3 TaxID=2738842 RepID=UPI00155721B7|nr:sigma-70 family RNA polymerase sigma factor [Brevibacillus sp. HB1.3]NQF16089.1 sigma-70 family RNA polymerase sigma factor [Brevibacillus sp. HB1.3]
MTKEECRTILRRIAWNLNYRERKRLRNECPILDDFGRQQRTFDNDNSLYVEELLQQLPNEKERHVIRKVVLEGFTAREVGEVLHIGERGVNQCKNRSLKKLHNYLITNSV